MTRREHLITAAFVCSLIRNRCVNVMSFSGQKNSHKTILSYFVFLQSVTCAFLGKILIFINFVWFRLTRNVPRTLWEGYEVLPVTLIECSFKVNWSLIMFSKLQHKIYTLFMELPPPETFAYTRVPQIFPWRSNLL